MPLACARLRPSVLNSDLHGAQQIQFALGNQLTHRLALDEFEGHVQDTVDLVHIIDLGDCGVRNGGRRPRLVQESSLSIRVVGDLLFEDLESHRPTQSCIHGAVDDAHASLTDQLLDLIVLERLSDQRHVEVIRASKGRDA